MTDLMLFEGKYVAPLDKVWMVKPEPDGVTWCIDSRCATNDGRLHRINRGWRIVKHEPSLRLCI